MKKITNTPGTKRAPRKQQTQDTPNKTFTTYQNTLSETIFGFNNGSIGTQLNQVATLFRNNRWYLVSNMRQLLSQIYVEHGLIQTVVDVPVDDGMRGGVGIQSKQLDEDQIKDLNIRLEREDILSSVVGRGLKWTRLFGGGGVVIITDQDPTKPLDMEALKGTDKLAFRAVDLWELYWDQQASEGFNPATDDEDFEFYSYYGTKLHKSRVMIMKGMEAPSFIRPRLRGWGFSFVEGIVASINQFMKANNLTFEILDEFKIDVYKIKNFSDTLLTAEGTAAVVRRLQLANQQKNFQNALTMDSEDDWDHKQLTFAGIADMMREFRIQLACDLRMPISKIFGIGSQGFSSGEDDIENYNAMVESQVRAKSKFHILKIIELMCMQDFGFIPDDLQIEFEPLRMLSAEQEENVKSQKFARLMQTFQTGMMTTEEFKDAINKENLLGIQLDTSIDQLDVELDREDDGAIDDGEFGPAGANKPTGENAKSKLEPKKPKEAKT